MAAGEGPQVRLPLPRTGSDELIPRSSALHFTVLGAVRIHRDGRRLPAGTPQQRALLATLLLRGGRTATAQELVDDVWGEEPPPQALAALRTYASRLRKVLGDRSGVLASEAGGYALRLGPADTLDSDRSAELAAEAEKSAPADAAHAHELYGRALDLWESEPLAGVPGPAADVHRTRLAEQRLLLQEQRLECGLQAGLHAEAVPELTALTTVHPLRERLRELLMLALYRCGRQAEALAVYADGRRVLIDELGVEPRAELSELQQRILHGDESLARPHSDATTQPPTPVRPAQLPAAVADFTGRAGFVAELSDQLTQDGGSVMALSAVAGIGGVGKTTLAVQVAHTARDDFPDGQLYVDLQGASSSPAEPEAVLGSFLRALGVADSAIPEGVEERSALYRSLLDGRRVLTLLDNGRDAAQIRPLLPGTPGCAALVTSRFRMVDLAGAHLVDLDVMSPDEALAFFSKIVGPERVAAEREAAMDTVAACGFLPLAIRIAAARLAARRTWTVATLARKLSDERRRLDELQAGDQAVKATFELGYSQLEAEQARAFRLLGLAEGPDISLHAAAALLDRTPEATEDVLEGLVDTSLIESAAPGRYRLHDLVRLFARACAERDELPPARRHAALHRLLDFYLATTTHAFTAERAGDRLGEHLEPVEQPGQSFDRPGDAVEWLFTEAGCLLACVQQSIDAPRLRRAADLLLVARDLSESGAFSRQYERACHVVLRAARELGDTWAEGRVHTALTQTDRHAGRYASSQAHGEQAIRLGLATGDSTTCANAANSLGIIAFYQSRNQEAETYLSQALDGFRADRNLPGEASVLSNLSRVNLNLGRPDEGVELAQRCLGILRSMGAHLRLANGLYTLGVALATSGRHHEAVTQLTEALDSFRANRQRLWEGMTLFRIAESEQARGDSGRAAALAEQALSQLRNVGGTWRRGHVLTLLGQALAGLGHHGRAEVCWEQALAIFEDGEGPEAGQVRDLLRGGQTSQTV